MSDEPKVTTLKIPCVGYEIAADWYEGTKEEVLLVLPGYTSTKLKYSQMVTAITEQTGMRALVIDYAGHGESPFKLENLSRAQNFMDSVHAFDWSRKNYPKLKITVMGTSYGGFHSTNLTKYRKFDRLILRVPAIYDQESFFTRIGDLKDLHSDEYRNNPDNFIDNWMFTHTESVLGKTLVITHELDTVCPPISTKPFAEAFKADRWVAKGFKHGFSESDVDDKMIEEYYSKVAEWLNK